MKISTATPLIKIIRIGFCLMSEAPWDVEKNEMFACPEMDTVKYVSQWPSAIVQ